MYQLAEVNIAGMLALWLTPSEVVPTTEQLLQTR